MEQTTDKHIGTNEHVLGPRLWRLANTYLQPKQDLVVKSKQWDGGKNEDPLVLEARMPFCFALSVLYYYGGP